MLCTNNKMSEHWSHWQKFLFVLIQHFSVMSGRVFFGWTTTNQGLMWLAQGHNASEARTRSPSVSRHALYHWAIALPEILDENVQMHTRLKICCTYMQKLQFSASHLTCKSKWAWSENTTNPQLHEEELQNTVTWHREDNYWTSTGHVTAPNKVPACGCLLSHRPSHFAGERLPIGLFWCMGWKLPLPSSLFGLETSRCLYTFITSFCTGHVAAPNNVRACGCMLSHRPSEFAGSVSQRSVPMHGVEASPSHLHCLGSKHPDVCLHRERHSPWTR